MMQQSWSESYVAGVGLSPVMESENAEHFQDSYPSGCAATDAGDVLDDQILMSRRDVFKLAPEAVAAASGSLVQRAEPSACSGTQT